jgi:hypothetical protein
MRKNYYFTFGSQLGDLEAVKEYLNERLELEFEARESSYLGEYYKYSGKSADRISIEKNFNQNENEWREENFMQFPVLIYVSISDGKNSDKESKSKYLKNALMELDNIQLLREDMIESKN